MCNWCVWSLLSAWCLLGIWIAWNPPCLPWFSQILLQSCCGWQWCNLTFNFSSRLFIFDNTTIFFVYQDMSLLLHLPLLNHKWQSRQLLHLGQMKTVDLSHISFNNQYWILYSITAYFISLCHFLYTGWRCKKFTKKIFTCTRACLPVLLIYGYAFNWFKEIRRLSHDFTTMMI